MRLRTNGVVRTGRAVDCRPLDVDAREVARGVRGDADAVVVDCPAPTPVHEYVGHVHDGTSVPVRAALAAAARQRGLSAPQDDDIAAVEAELVDLDPPAVDLSGARQQVAATADAEVESVRETAAARRGAVQARQELDAATDEASEALTDAIRRLSEVETERAAAAQALERARKRARRARDVRERRLRLEDRVGNLRRAARDHLAAELRDAFAAAVAAVPGSGTVPDDPSEFDGDPVTAALAVARLAEYRAPVVVAVDRFTTPEAAARTLDGPVVLA